jgi:hypothetical protein
MTRYIILLAALLSVALCATHGSCQDDTKTVDGRLLSVDPQNSVIVVKSSENLTFSVASGARITDQDGNDLELSDLKIGSYVMVGYYTDRSGGRVTNDINVEYNS